MLQNLFSRKRLGVGAGLVFAGTLVLIVPVWLAGPHLAGAAVTARAAVPATEEERVIQTTAKSAPAVVSIVIRKELESNTVVIDGSGARALPQEKKLEEVGQGTGFAVSADGMIVTNRHVAGDRSAVYDVILADQRSFRARILDIDPVNDLALLKIEAFSLPTLQLETDDRLRLGQTVIAIGNALGKYSNTVTRGILSGVERTLEATDFLRGGTERLEDILQTDASISEGNSGGPLLNLDGKVIGVNVAVDRGGEGLGFAIPVSELRKVLASYARYGAIARPRLGLRYLMITPELVIERSLASSYGALLDSDEAGRPSVLPNSPAAAIGLRDGDIILEANGRKIEGRRTLGKEVQSLSVGDVVTLKILRDGAEIVLRAALDAHPPYTR